MKLKIGGQAPKATSRTSHSLASDVLSYLGEESIGLVRTGLEEECSFFVSSSLIRAEEC